MDRCAAARARGLVLPISRHRRQEPLGTDKVLALRRWAELECTPPTGAEAANLLSSIFERYRREELPKKAPRTQTDDGKMLDLLSKAFGVMAIDQIQPKHVRGYLDRRTAKVRANREMSLFSRVWNQAREWGYTDRANPVQGVTKNVESGRDINVTDAAAEAQALGIDFRRWQIRDLRPKGATDLGSFVEARKLLGHCTETMTAHYVRKRVGDEVKPVK